MVRHMCLDDFEKAQKAIDSERSPKPHVSKKKLGMCLELLTLEFKGTKEIQVALGVSRDHTIKLLGLLCKNGLAIKKKQRHDYNTCNKKEHLWARKESRK